MTGGAAAAAAGTARSAASGSRVVENYVTQTYRPGTNSIPGGTAGALEFEFENRVRLSKTGHYAKTVDSLKRVDDVLSNDPLNPAQRQFLVKERARLQNTLNKVQAAAHRANSSPQAMLCTFTKVHSSDLPNAAVRPRGSIRANAPRIGRAGGVSAINVIGLYFMVTEVSGCMNGTGPCFIGDNRPFRDPVS